VPASAIATFDSKLTLNLPGVPAGTGVLLNLDFLVSGFVSALTVGNVALSATSELLLGLGLGPGYNVSFDQISPGDYQTEGFIFTGQAFRVNGSLTTEVISGRTAVGGDPNNPFGFPFNTSATFDLLHTLWCSAERRFPLGGQPVTNFVLLDESGNPISFGPATGAPEPGTVGLVALALIALAGRRRR
jgi:hypothetical protein